MKFDATYDNITDTFHITLAEEGPFISREKRMRVIVEAGIDIVGLKIPNFRKQCFLPEEENDKCSTTTKTTGSL